MSLRRLPPGVPPESPWYWRAPSQQIPGEATSGRGEATPPRRVRLRWPPRCPRLPRPSEVITMSSSPPALCPTEGFESLRVLIKTLPGASPHCPAEVRVGSAVCALRGQRPPLHARPLKPGRLPSRTGSSGAAAPSAWTQMRPRRRAPGDPRLMMPARQPATLLRSGPVWTPRPTRATRRGSSSVRGLFRLELAARHWSSSRRSSTAAALGRPVDGRWSHRRPVSDASS